MEKFNPFAATQLYRRWNCLLALTICIAMPLCFWAFTELYLTEIFFTAIRARENEVMLTMELPKDTGVEVQYIDALGQALGQVEWKSFKVIAPSDQAQTLNVTDRSPLAPERFYRLKIQSGD